MLKELIKKLLQNSNDKFVNDDLKLFVSKYSVI